MEKKGSFFLIEGRVSQGQGFPFQGVEIEDLENADVEQVFFRLMARFDPSIQPQNCAVAFSGGADSTALLFLVARWVGDCVDLKRNKKEKDAEHFQTKPWAFIVDHGLRKESRQEAEKAQNFAQSLGFQTEILFWKHKGIQTDLQRRAREARYALLSQACRDKGVEDLLVAHHLEDQIETFCLRERKKSGPWGLAGMSAQRFLDERVRLCRPLLWVPKTKIRKFVAQKALPFTEDPSNQNRVFERIRIRQDLTLEERGKKQHALFFYASKRVEEEKLLDDFFKRNTDLSKAGVLKLMYEPWQQLPSLLQEQALRKIFALYSKGQEPIRLASIKRLTARLRSDSVLKATLAETVIQRKGTEILFFPEEIYLPLEPKESDLRKEYVLWRDFYALRVEGKSLSLSVCLKPLGTEEQRELRNSFPQLPSAVFRLLPGVLFQENLWEERLLEKFEAENVKRQNKEKKTIYVPHLDFWVGSNDIKGTKYKERQEERRLALSKGISATFVPRINLQKNRFYL